jgi:cytochrome c biogenesis protein CcmG, thiol:disulfide interchange protein DsbE
VKFSLSRLFDWILYAALAAMAVVFVTRKMSGPDEGEPAARFDLPVVGASGSRFRLDEHRGKPVLVEVFASWCGACRRAAPAVADAYQKHGRDRVAFIGVSLDGSLADAQRVKREWEIPYDVALDDGSVSKGYRIEALPTFVLIGPDGVVQRVSTGAPSRSELDRWLTEL